MKLISLAVVSALVLASTAMAEKGSSFAWKMCVDRHDNYSEWFDGCKKCECTKAGKNTCFKQKCKFDNDEDKELFACGVTHDKKKFDYKDYKCQCHLVGGIICVTKDQQQEVIKFLSH